MTWLAGLILAFQIKLFAILVLKFLPMFAFGPGFLPNPDPDFLLNPDPDILLNLDPDILPNPDPAFFC